MLGFYSPPAADCTSRTIFRRVAAGSPGQASMTACRSESCSNWPPGWPPVSGNACFSSEKPGWFDSRLGHFSGVTTAMTRQPAGGATSSDLLPGLPSLKLPQSPRWSRGARFFKSQGQVWRPAFPTPVVNAGARIEWWTGPLTVRNRMVTRRSRSRNLLWCGNLAETLAMSGEPECGILRCRTPVRCQRPPIGSETNSSAGSRSAVAESEPAASAASDHYRCAQAPAPGLW